MARRSKAMASVRRKVNQFDDLIKEKYVDNIENYYVPVMINIILQEYDSQLTGRVTDRRSRTNPIFYREEFREALERWDWMRKDGTGYKLVTPEVNTFNWRQGRLTIIERILEGLIGQYVEIDGEQYVSMYKKPAPIQEAFDKTVPRKQRIYTLKFSNSLFSKWRETYPGKQMVEYPFSNQPPVDIFSSTNDYVDENLAKWVKEAVKEATKEIGE